MQHKNIKSPFTAAAVSTWASGFLCAPGHITGFYLLNSISVASVSDASKSISKITSVLMACVLAFAWSALVSLSCDACTSTCPVHWELLDGTGNFWCSLRSVVSGARTPCCQCGLLLREPLSSDGLGQSQVLAFLRQPHTVLLNCAKLSQVPG